MREFYLKKRKGFYLAEFLNPETGEVVCYRSTMTKNRDEALMLASTWLRDGIPVRKRGKQPVYKKPAQPMRVVSNLSSILKAIENTALDEAAALQIAETLRNRGLLALPVTGYSGGNIDFIDFLKNFYDYGKSPYICEKLAHGQTIGETYCAEAIDKVRLYYAPYFGNKKLISITRKDLKDFSVYIAGLGKSSYYNNGILSAGTIPLAYAARENLIPINPAAGLRKYAHTGKKRGCLTQAEAEAVFSAPWTDREAYIANLIAMTTGLRQGEILAIAKNDIDPEKPILYVRHSMEYKQQILKAPKNGETRKVPLLPEVRALLMELLKDNPHEVNNPFIFYGLEPNKPRYDGKFMNKGLYGVLDGLGIDRKGRKIVFHSWRHYYCSRLADTMTADQVMRASGHKSKTVFDAYAAHLEDKAIEDLAEAGSKVFSNVLKFTA
jgi:integrase